jgi:hypothetical protein
MAHAVRTDCRNRYRREAVEDDCDVGVLEDSLDRTEYERRVRELASDVELERGERRSTVFRPPVYPV